MSELQGDALDRHIVDVLGGEEDPEKPVQEPGIPILCAKGCGEPVLVPMFLLEEATKAGIPFEAKHEKCPGEDGNVRRFQIDIDVYELVGDGKVPIKVAHAGSGVIEDKSFSAALPLLTRNLNVIWTKKIATLSGVVDASPPTEADANDD